MKFGLHTFTFNFLLADVAWPILGFDFLCVHHLDVSPSVPSPLAQVSSEILQKIPADMQQLLTKIPGILGGENLPPAPTHGVENVLKTSGPPTSLRHKGLITKS